MKTRFLTTTFGFLAISAANLFAADPETPVREIMGIAAGTVEADGGYFGEKQLETLYSASFANTYRLAVKAAELSGDDYMVDWDVLLGGQDDHCDLKDLQISQPPHAASSGSPVVPVHARFDVNYCRAENTGAQTGGDVLFHVIEENGRHVIDDFWQSPGAEGDAGKSTKELYRDVAVRDIDRLADLKPPQP